jgi:MFS family permease
VRPGGLFRILSGSEFAPAVRQALGVEISSTVFLAGFVCLTEPFVGLLLRRELGATPFQLSAMASAAAACLLLAPAWARLLDGRPPLGCAVWPALGGRALFLLMPAVHTAWPFIAILVGAQLLTAVASPAHAAVVQRVYPRAQRGRALGVVKMAGAVPAIGLTAAGGALLAMVGYRWLFPAAACLGMAASLRLRRLPVPATPGDVPERTRLGGVRTALREDARFRRLLLAHFLFGWGVWMQLPANPLVVADVAQATTTQLGLITAVGAAAGLAGSGVWGRVVDRAGPARALRAVYLVGAVLPLCFYVARSPWLLVGASVSEGLMASGLELVWLAALVDVAPRGRVAQYVAISTTLVGVRGVAAPLASALVIHALGVHAVYLFAAAAMLAAVWLLHRRAQPAAVGLALGAPAAVR